MKWHKKAILTNVEKIVIGSLYGLICIWITILLNYFYSWNFDWTIISPIETPWFVPRIFLSALAFWLPWAFLYKIYFYKFLYDIFSYRTFKKIKEIIWLFLMFLMYITIQVVVEFLNFIISLFYNLMNLLVFILPWLGISFIIVLTWSLIYIRYKSKNPNVLHKKTNKFIS